MSFSNLKLSQNLLKVLAELGFSTPTPIQEQAIPLILNGSDLRASAQTGTGKTAAYLLPLLHKLITPTGERFRGPRVLILVPTRELAMQVATETTKLSKYLSRVKNVCIYGGAPYPPQNRQLSRPYEILIATPGRMIDHMEQRRIDLSQIETVILDEADRMLDMGFIDPVKQIMAATPKKRQTLLFSATLKGPVLQLSQQLLTAPLEISIAQEQPQHEHISQKLYFVDDLRHKQKILNHLLDDPEVHQAIVFTSTKRYADELVDILHEEGCSVAALHGDMNQRQRTRTMNRMRQGELKILVATDVAARGLDVSTISHVINFDLPHSVEDYVHRIGRTGRAGVSGTALSFAAKKERPLVQRIEQFLGHKIELHSIPGLEPQLKESSKKPAGAKKFFRRPKRPPMLIKNKR